jgi:CRP-like cAMP-binding protein
MRLDEAIAEARRSRWLSQQAPAFQDALCGRMRLLNLKKNDSLFHLEDSAHEIFCLVRGAVLFSIVHPIHGLVVAHTALPGEWFGEPATLGNRPRMMSVHARLACDLVAVSRGSAEDILRRNPEFCWNFFNLMARKGEDYMLHAVDLLIQDPRRRMCSRLLTLAGRLLNYLPPAPVTVPLSQEELALASNMSRQTAHLLLGELVQQGICTLGYREIRIIDMAALARIVSDAPAAAGA